MIRHYRIDRVNGLEVLVCEVYDGYIWSQSEFEAFGRWLEDFNKTNPPSSRSTEESRRLRGDFRIDLNEWCDSEHEKGESFYGLTEPIPTISSFPSIVFRGILVNGTVGSLQADRAQSVPNMSFEDEFHRFVRFVENPHWRNTISHQFERYGTLFTSDND